MEHYETAPEDRISVPQRLIYGLGAFVNNLLGFAIGSMVIVLNIGLGVNPALVGLLGALPRLTDAITDPLIGYISDNTRSRWGRRRPYIFAGAILAGVTFALLWQLPVGKTEAYYFWFFLIGSLIFYLAYTIFATPWVALGYELTPDYHERTRLMGTSNFIGQIAYMIAPYFLAIMHSERLFDDIVDGAAGLGMVIGAAVIMIGVLPAIFLRERLQPSVKDDEVEGPGILANVKDFFHGFLTTLRFRPFQKLCIATFLVFNGFILIAGLQPYVIMYYVFEGDTASGAELVGHVGALAAASALVIVVFITWLATKIGKRRAFFVSTGVSMVGYTLKWFCYSPEQPLLILLPAPLIAFGFAGLFTLMPSMIADVVDMDELNTNERREGMYGSIFWWVVKLGQAVALAASGILLNSTGFDVQLEGNQAESTLATMRFFDAFVPVIASGIAIWAVATFTITEEKAHEVRVQLEQRRGK
jgi:GPH family glycoside/pentoside/hexuronide:cation symporter